MFMRDSTYQEWRTARGVRAGNKQAAETAQTTHQLLAELLAEQRRANAIAAETNRLLFALLQTTQAAATSPAAARRPSPHPTTR